jgi:predicted nucleic acid-binding Zn ribbon protein
MLYIPRHCAQCSAEMQTIRSTKTYCSDACRKKAARGGIEQKAESRRIVEWLRRVGLIAEIWSVFPWDNSPPVFTLMVPTQAALEELNLCGSTLRSALPRQRCVA